MKLRFFLALVLSQLLTVTAVFGTATVKFANPVPYNGGSWGTNYVVAADLTGDGCPDMIVANGGGVAVRLNNCDGTGTFGPPVVYSPAGYTAFAVAVGDVNNDGIPDLVETNYCDLSCSHGTVGVLIGNGDGTFKPAVSYDAGGIDTRAVVVGDVNKDGWNDIVVTSGCQVETCVDGSIRLLLNNGDGTFNLVPFPISPSLGGPLAIGDMNGDGNLDLVADVGVLLGNGDGTFQQPLGHVPGGTISIAIADVNRDGIMDLVVADQVSVLVKLGIGDGTFQPIVSYDAGIRPFWVAVADFNGDGNLDIAVANECSAEIINNILCPDPKITGAVGVFPGKGDGTFNPDLIYASGADLATSVAVADVNGDTKPDILVSNACSDGACINGTIGVLLNIFKAVTSINVSSNMNPSAVNQPVTLTATIVSQVPIPDGSSVTFSNANGTIGTGTTVGGVATLNFTFLFTGTKTITATFPGDIYHNAATSGTFTQTVTLWPSTTMVTANPSTSTYATPVTFTATVSSGAPGGATGMVTFTNTTSGLVFGTVPLSGGVAVWTAPHPRLGTSTIKAAYSGDSQSAASSGTTLITVN
ncbi:MAG: FG-GAP-like repeat-containing protein [Terriglobales bacterium]